MRQTVISTTLLSSATPASISCGFHRENDEPARTFILPNESSILSLPGTNFSDSWVDVKNHQLYVVESNWKNIIGTSLTAVPESFIINTNEHE